MTPSVDRTTATLAIATGVIAIASLLSLITFFTVGGLFGPFNDIGNGVTGLLSGVLAWRLGGGLGGRVAVWIAMAGAAVVAAGSLLILSGTTGFFLAGLVSSTGFGLVGIWLAALNRQAPPAWPRRLATLGLVAGVLMVFGLVTAPGIVLGISDMATAPAWIWLGFVGWLGAFIAYPAWAIWLGRSVRRSAA
jgi:hypothetical protein